MNNNSFDVPKSSDNKIPSHSQIDALSASLNVSGKFYKSEDGDFSKAPYIKNHISSHTPSTVARAKYLTRKVGGGEVVSRVARLEEEKKDLEEKYDKSLRNSHIVDFKVNRLILDLRDAENYLEKHKTEIKRLREEISLHAEENKNLKNERTDLLADLDLKKIEIDELEKKVGDIEDELKKEIKKVLEEAEKEKERNSKEKEEFKERLLKQNKIILGLIENKKHSEENQKRLEGALSGKIKSISDKEGDTHEAQALLSVLTKELNELKTKHAEITDEKNVLETQKQEIENALKDLTDAVESQFANPQNTQDTQVEKNEDPISDEAYKEFTDNGIVDEEVLNEIAKKISEGKELSKRELSIHAYKTKAVEVLLGDIKRREEKHENTSKLEEKTFSDLQNDIAQIKTKLTLAEYNYKKEKNSNLFEGILLAALGEIDQLLKDNSKITFLYSQLTPKTEGESDKDFNKRKTDFDNKKKIARIKFEEEKKYISKDLIDENKRIRILLGLEDVAEEFKKESSKPTDIEGVYNSLSGINSELSTIFYQIENIKNSKDHKIGSITGIELSLLVVKNKLDKIEDGEEKNIVNNFYGTVKKEFDFLKNINQKAHEEKIKTPEKSETEKTHDLLNKVFMFDLGDEVYKFLTLNNSKAYNVEHAKKWNERNPSNFTSPFLCMIEITDDLLEKVKIKKSILNLTRSDRDILLRETGDPDLIMKLEKIKEVFDSFVANNRENEDFKSFVEKLENAKHDTASEGYLISAGLTKDQISRLQKAFRPEGAYGIDGGIVRDSKDAIEQILREFIHIDDDAEQLSASTTGAEGGILAIEKLRRLSGKSDQEIVRILTFIKDDFENFDSRERIKWFNALGLEELVGRKASEYKLDSSLTEQISAVVADRSLAGVAFDGLKNRFYVTKIGGIFDRRESRGDATKNSVSPAELYDFKKSVEGARAHDCGIAGFLVAIAHWASTEGRIENRDKKVEKRNFNNAYSELVNYKNSLDAVNDATEISEIDELISSMTSTSSKKIIPEIAERIKAAREKRDTKSRVPEDIINGWTSNEVIDEVEKENQIKKILELKESIKDKDYQKANFEGLENLSKNKNLPFSKDEFSNLFSKFEEIISGTEKGYKQKLEEERLGRERLEEEQLNLETERLENKKQKDFKITEDSINGWFEDENDNKIYENTTREDNVSFVKNIKTFEDIPAEKVKNIGDILNNKFEIKTSVFALFKKDNFKVFSDNFKDMKMKDFLSINDIPKGVDGSVMKKISDFINKTYNDNKGSVNGIEDMNLSQIALLGLLNSGEIKESDLK